MTSLENHVVSCLRLVLDSDELCAEKTVDRQEFLATVSFFGLLFIMERSLCNRPAGVTLTSLLSFACYAALAMMDVEMKTIVKTLEVLHGKPLEQKQVETELATQIDDIRFVFEDSFDRMKKFSLLASKLINVSPLEACDHIEMFLEL